MKAMEVVSWQTGPGVTLRKTMSQKEITALIEKFNQPGEKAPLAAISKVVQFGRASLPSLIEALQKSENVRLRRWSAAALGEVGNRQTLFPLRKALQDANMSVKLRAILALEQLKDPELGTHLPPLLQDSSGGVRVNVIDAMARIKFKKAQKQLIKATNDEKWYVRQAAARALGQLKIGSARESLKKLLKDERKAVREAAENSLKILP
jgi:HEAT repeat protein